MIFLWCLRACQRLVRVRRSLWLGARAGEPVLDVDGTWRCAARGCYPRSRHGGVAEARCAVLGLCFGRFLLVRGSFFRFFERAVITLFLFPLFTISYVRGGV
ncbi:unnamed protein product, partial [Scytosiphon promiscuus]